MNAKHTPVDDELDAWECIDCGGDGRVTVYHDVTHLLGTDSFPFWETCPTCDGLKFCGPDADKRAAIAKAYDDAAQKQFGEFARLNLGNAA